LPSIPDGLCSSVAPPELKSRLSPCVSLEYSGCGVLALAAGFTLGPPTGAAVGFYCTGNIYLASR
jgi:hypothetical protein